MENFVNLLNSKDARWIIDADEIPEDYDGEDLKPIVEQIMLEDEKLSGNNYYSNYIEDEIFKEYQKSKVIAYTTFQMCLKHEMSEEVNNIKVAWKFKVKTWDEANRKVKSIQQMMLNAEDNKKKKKEGGEIKLDYGAMIANLVFRLKITPYPMTVSQYRAHEKQVKQLTAKIING